MMIVLDTIIIGIFSFARKSRPIGAVLMVDLI